MLRYPERSRSWLGRWWEDLWTWIEGGRYLEENWVLTIYRAGEYYEARPPLPQPREPGAAPAPRAKQPDPRFARIARFGDEQAGPEVYAGSRLLTLVQTNLLTHDGLAIGLKIYFGYSFDPRRTSRDTAASLVNAVLRVEQEQGPGKAREVFDSIVERNLHRSLLAIVSAFNAELICRGQAYDDIEKRLKEELPPRLVNLGIRAAGFQVQDVIVPELLKDRFAQSAQHRVSFETVEAYAPSQIAQSLATQLVEKFGGPGASEKYMNVGDTLGQLAQATGQSGAGAKIVDGKPASQPDSTSSTPPPAGLPGRSRLRGD